MSSAGEPIVPIMPYDELSPAFQARSRQAQQRQRHGKFSNLRGTGLAAEGRPCSQDRCNFASELHYWFSTRICAVAFICKVKDWNGRLNP